jgi:hypothetical protein
MENTYSLEIAVENVVSMKVYETQQYVVKLHITTVRHESKRGIRNSYYLQSATIRVFLNVVKSIPVFHVGHNNERSIIELICSEKF